MTALHALELGLPLAGHCRALHLGVDDRNESNTLRRCLEGFARTEHVFTAQQGLDDLSPRGRRTEPKVAHRVGELLLLQALPSVFHGREQGGFGEAPWGAGTLGHGGRVHHRGCESPAQPGWERRTGASTGLFRVVGTRVGAPATAFGRTLALSEVQHLPAHLIDGRAPALVVVDDGRGLCRGNGRDDRRHRVHVVGVPALKEAPTHEIIDLLFVVAEAASAGGRDGGDDGVVIGYAGIVDESPT